MCGMRMLFIRWAARSCLFISFVFFFDDWTKMKQTTAKSKKNKKNNNTHTQNRNKKTNIKESNRKNCLRYSCSEINLSWGDFEEQKKLSEKFWIEKFQKWHPTRARKLTNAACSTTFFVCVLKIIDDSNVVVWMHHHVTMLAVTLNFRQMEAQPMRQTMR